MPVALVLNLLTIGSGYLGFRALFCNSIDCVYEGANTMCEAVNITDSVCVNDPYSCNCGSSVQKNNSFCDVANNNCACGWDGGDCCLPNLSVDECDGINDDEALCNCLDPVENYPCNGVCTKPEEVGDGLCHDGNNNCGCDWDGGDCCFT